MVSFLWGDVYKDSEDSSTQEDLTTEFKNYMTDSNDNSFYNKTLLVKYSFEEDSTEEERFDDFIQQIMDGVLAEDLGQWLKKSPGWARFIMKKTTSGKVKTGVDDTGKDIFSTKDKQVENSANKRFIEGKTLKEVLDSKVVRRLKGLNYLRNQEENLQRELSEEEISQMFEDAKYRYEIDLTESTNQEGVPTGKINTGTGNLQDKKLKDVAHMVIEFPNVEGDEVTLDSELEVVSKERAKELSNLTGNSIKTVKKSEGRELATIVLENYDFSLSEEFIEKINSEHSRKKLTTTMYEVGKLGEQARPKVSRGEWLRLIKNEYAKYTRKFKKVEERAKKEGKKISIVDPDILIEEDEIEGKDKLRPQFSQRKLTLTEFRNKQAIAPIEVTYPVTPFILQVFTTVSETNEATIPYDYDAAKKEWVELPKEMEPITWTMKGGDHKPVSLDYRNDAQINKLISAISERLIPEALKSPILKDYNKIVGVVAKATLKVNKAKSKKMFTVVRESLQSELEGKEPKDTFEISEGWQNKETKKIISDSDYRKLPNENKKNYLESFRPTGIDDVTRIRDAEKENDVSVTDMAGQDVTSDYTAIKYRTGLVPLDELNEFFSKINVEVKAYTSQVYEIPPAQMRPTKNKDLSKTIDSYKKQIRRMKRLLRTNEGES